VVNVVTIAAYGAVLHLSHEPGELSHTVQWWQHHKQ